MSIEGPVPAGILPDMSVVLSVYQPASPNPLPVVPIGAIDFTPARETAVWVWDPVTEKVTRRTVIARHPVGDHVLVESGLAAGEQIVTAGIGALAEGTRIRPLVTATR
jgi:multidrug efflux pump subunit AcrA (membrane-fusion protein)